VIPAGYPDEWTFCATEGKAVCGPVLEAHYASWFTTADIDRFSQYGINTLRIPTSYAAWYDVPGSQLYHGNQQAYLRTISNYAISKGMHVIIGLHSLPGGTNFLDIGEALTHIGWWYNSTNFDYSLKVIDNVLSFVQSSANPNQFTVSPINEPCDDFSNFATPNTVSYPDGVNYLNTYMRAVYAKIQKVNKNIPLMISDAFMGASYWAPYWTKGQNVVFDSHFCKSMHATL
jgi:glucan 1,3-beta-glucosidase